MLYGSLIRDQLIRLGQAFAAATGTGITVVARDHARDSYFFRRIERSGVTFTVATADRVICSIARAWPADRPWPDGIPRPSEDEIQAVIQDAPHGREAAV